MLRNISKLKLNLKLKHNFSSHFPIFPRAYTPRRSPTNEAAERDLESLFESIEQDVNFDQLKPINRNIYSEHPEVTKQTSDEVDQILEQNEVRTSSKVLPIKNFDHLNVNRPLVLKLKTEFDAPTVIQRFGIPTTLSGNNLIGVSITGSGKTLSFGVPLIEHVLRNRSSENEGNPLALVMVPTWELGTQVCAHINEFGKPSNVSGTLMVGGESVFAQVKTLNHNCDFIVGTPGRLLDLLNRGLIELRYVSFLVLDEADVMLDMGFLKQIRVIIDKRIRPDRQCTMWSATWSKTISDLASNYIEKPVTIKVGSGQITANKNVDQKVELVKFNAKKSRLNEILSEDQYKNERVIIFCNTKDNCDLLEDVLNSRGFEAVALHGGKERDLRKQVYQDLVQNFKKILIATDVASRGIDLKDVKLVVNYDFPHNIETYVHRIGRTGRVHKKGNSISFFMPDDRYLAPDLVKILQDSNMEVPEKLTTLAEML